MGRFRTVAFFKIAFDTRYTEAFALMTTLSGSRRDVNALFRQTKVPSKRGICKHGFEATGHMRLPSDCIDTDLTMRFHHYIIIL
jgi:hypothetical protein